MIALSKRLPLRLRKPAWLFIGASYGLDDVAVVREAPLVVLVERLAVDRAAVLSILPIAISSATTAGTPPAR